MRRFLIFLFSACVCTSIFALATKRTEARPSGETRAQVRGQRGLPLARHTTPLMSRWPTPPTGPDDSLAATEGDTTFVGINSKLPPESLPPGIARAATNKTFRNGKAATRGGCVTPASHNPRLLYETLEVANFLEVKFEWTAQAGIDPEFAVLFLSGAGDALDGLTLPTCDPEHVNYPTTVSGVVVAVNEIQTVNKTAIISLSLCQIRLLADIFSDGEIVLRFGAKWRGATQAAGRHGRVSITVTPHQFTGSLLDPALLLVLYGWPANEGTHHHYQTQLYTDSGAGAVPYDFAGDILLDVDPAVPVVIRFPGLTTNFGSVGSGSGYFATLPDPGLDTIFGTGRYTDPSADEWLLLATPAGVWKVRDGRTPQLYATPSALAADVEFTQLADTVFLWRGSDLIPWEWSAASAAWAAVSQIDPGDGTRPLPGTVGAEVIGNRFVFTLGLDQVGFGDLLSRYYDPLLSLFRVQSGKGGIVRVLQFSNNSAIVFKSRSIHLLENITGDLTGLALSDVNLELGLSARHACVQVGADVFFLSDTGVFRISQVVQSRIATQPIPVSDAIEPFFRYRVNWRAISGASATVHGEYFHLALPIDGSEVNNALLCYNTTTSQWEGHHEFPAGAELAAIITTAVDGRERLFATDRARGLVYLLGEGRCDRIMQNRYEISDLLETRAYMIGDNGQKRFTSIAAILETWRPVFSITATTEGVASRYPIKTGKTLSPVAYYRHGISEYNPSNAADNHAAPYREDYSLTLATPFQLRSGIVFDADQVSKQRAPARIRARWVTLEITSTQGACTVQSTEVEGRQVDRSPKARA